MLFKNSILRKALSLFLIASMVFSFAGCSSESAPVYSRFHETFSDFDTLEPLLTEYFTGVVRAYNRADPEDVFTYELDEETELAQTDLEYYLNNYASTQYAYASQEDQERFDSINLIYREFAYHYATFNVSLSVYQLQSDNDFSHTHIVTESNFADLLADLKEYLDKAYADFAKNK